ncbi:cupin-like domain-containing protein [Sandarakinorhabdus sp.]|uniref:cupin-like domain-containing protein n=1 Tax=Sandarakinorhabdus sp. TaxID=1916663 RepID=UPI0033419E6E
MADALAATLPAVREAFAADAAALDALIAAADGPFVVRGLVADWPLVRAGLQSARAARAHLLDHARSRDFTVSMGAPQDSGRLFYDADMQMNFRMGQGRLPAIFAGFDAAESHAQVPTVYLGSVDIEQYFDGLAAANPMPLSPRSALASVWIGTPTRIAAHNDFPDNLACCAVGTRRFTLFAPDQFRNLYLGPIDNTPAGRAVSMVDLAAPDFAVFPGFAEALRGAQVADLNPGDALFIPSLWYHHVEAFAPFNVLINYWWRDTPRFLGQPQNALNHAVLAIRDLPQAQRDIWRQMFEYYVFSGGDEAAAHVPEHGRGVLAPFDADTAGRMHAFLLRSLSK